MPDEPNENAEPRDRRTEDHPDELPTAEVPESKKDQIISLYLSGVDDIEDLALLTDARPSYVSNVLQDENLLSGYFDLYTSTSEPMNVYSKYFAGRLGFKDVERARESVRLIDRLYRQFARNGDRAGQHHASMMALVMFNRARWTGKHEEADVFRQWLFTTLEASDPGEKALPEE